MPSYNQSVIHNDLKCVNVPSACSAGSREPAARGSHHFLPPPPRLLVSSVGRGGSHYLNFVLADSSFRRQSLLALSVVEIYLSRRGTREKRKREREREREDESRLAILGNRSDGFEKLFGEGWKAVCVVLVVVAVT